MTEFEEATSGFVFAIQATLRALIKSHPNPAALIQAFATERELTMSTLIARSNSDRSIDACRDFFEGVDPQGGVPDEEAGA